MPSIKPRITNRNSWSVESMKQAIDAIKTGKYGYKKAAQVYNVPKSTLERRVKGTNKVAKGTIQQLGSKSRVFSLAQEKQLANHIKQMESMLFGLSRKSVMSLAFQFAELNSIPHPFNKTTMLAGKDWYRDFAKRNKLSVRTPEATSAARARAFNQPSVYKFFDIYEDTCQKYQFPIERKWNVDETGILTVPNKPSKIVATTGKKQVGILTSAERGELTTAVICSSAAGGYVPPMMIIPRERMKEQFYYGAPPGTLKTCYKNGWMQLHLFVQWFEHFIKHVKPTKQDPVLLILDGHKTHTQNLKVINLARANGVVILVIPPHTSHRLQPEDVSLMFPLSTFYTQEVETWLRNNPGRVVTTYQVAELFGRAYLKAATPSNAMSGWFKSGLSPINRYIFPEEAFVAAKPTDRELGDEDSEPELAPTVAEGGAEPSTSVSVPATPTHIAESEPNATTSASPEDIIPFPKADSAPKKRKSANQGKAGVITESPYKNELEKKLKKAEEEKIEKQRRKEEREKKKKEKLKKDDMKPRKKSKVVKKLIVESPQQSPEKAPETDTPEMREQEPSSPVKKRLREPSCRRPLNMSEINLSEDSDDENRPSFIKGKCDSDSDEYIPSDE